MPLSLFFIFLALFAGPLGDHAVAQIRDGTQDHAQVDSVSVADTLKTIDDAPLSRAGDVPSSTQPLPSEPGSVRYSADLITYDTSDSALVLTGNASLQYDNITLKAGRVRFHTFSEILTAESLPDSAGLAPDANPSPTLEEEEGALEGDWMEYNLKTRRGRILRGRTRYEQGFFEGQHLRVDDRNILRINAGSYTTCDNPEHRHYWLKVRRAKIMANDKAIVKDVTAYVYGMPVFYLPFYVLPLKRGRHSGFTVPNYGSGPAEGVYFRNVGYYWAASDYWDMKVTGDFTAAQGLLLKPQLRYAKERRLNGSISGSYQSTFGFKPTGWDIAASHWQELKPDLRVRGQAQFADRLSFVQSTTRGYNPGRIQSSLRSSLSVDKNWGQKSLNFSISESSPTGSPVRPTTALSFRFPTVPIFAPPRRRSTGNMPDFGSTVSTGRPLWYQRILFGYNGNIRDQKLGTNGTRQDLTNQFNVSSQQSVGGWLNLQPQSSYTETWFRQTDQGFDRLNAYTAGLQANTTLYGLFQTDIGALKALRHVVTPNLSFSQTGPRNPSRSINLSLNNIFQAKTGDGEEERKYDLLSVNFSSGYNFKALSRRLSNLNTSVRTPGRRVNFDAGLSHDFYEPATGRFRRPWLRTASINTTINLSGQSQTGPDTGGANIGGQTDGFYGSAPGGWSSSPYGNDRYDEQFDRVKQPWTVSLSHRYAISRATPASGFSTSSHLLSASNRFDLDRITDLMGISNGVTRKWRIEHNLNYDVRRRAMVSHSFTFYRTLHCWELLARWTPTGFNRGIYFRLNIIAHPEIKIEQQRLGN